MYTLYLLVVVCHRGCGRDLDNRLRTTIIADLSAPATRNDPSRDKAFKHWSPEYDSLSILSPSYTVLMQNPSTWSPKRSIKECDEIITGPGRLHELELSFIDGRVLRTYKNLPEVRIHPPLFLLL